MKKNHAWRSIPVKEMLSNAQKVAMVMKKSGLLGAPVAPDAKDNPRRTEFSQGERRVFHNVNSPVFGTPAYSELTKLHRKNQILDETWPGFLEDLMIQLYSKHGKNKNKIMRFILIFFCILFKKGKKKKKIINKS